MCGWTLRNPADTSIYKDSTRERENFLNRSQLNCIKSSSNVDYKIATKALATRLKKVLPSIISNSQTGYLEGRFIGENIRQIADVLQFTLDQNLSGITLFLDFEKAFDCLEWDFLHKALEAFNFGENFSRLGSRLCTKTFLVASSTTAFPLPSYATTWCETGLSPLGTTFYCRRGITLYFHPLLWCNKRNSSFK